MSDAIIESGERELESLRRMTRHDKGRLFVLSGPSGVGKDALLDAFELQSPGVLQRCVTMTTREPRIGEVPGVDYHFESLEEFHRLAEAGNLLEWAKVHGNFYGTPRVWVEEQLTAGKDVVLKIDVQGGLTVKKRMPEVVMIFVAPPSFAELERRLRGRNSETPEEFQLRLENARKELGFIPEYDYLVVNDVLETAAKELAAIVVAERCRIAPF